MKPIKAKDVTKLMLLREELKAHRRETTAIKVHRTEKQEARFATNVYEQTHSAWLNSKMKG